MEEKSYGYYVRVASVGEVDFHDTKGSSVIVSFKDSDGVNHSFFLPKKHLKADKFSTEYVNLFMMKEWEYSCPMSHWDESEHKYVQDPVKYVSGEVIMNDLVANTKLTKIKKVELKPRNEVTEKTEYVPGKNNGNDPLPGDDLPF